MMIKRILLIVLFFGTALSWGQEVTSETGTQDNPELTQQTTEVPQEQTPAENPPVNEQAVADTLPQMTPDQFVILCNRELGEIQENLSAKKWVFYSAVDEVPSKYGNARFVYDRPYYQPGDTADYFFTFYYSDAVGAQGVELFFKRTDTYKSFSEWLVNMQYKLSSSTIKNGSIIKVYKKGSQIVEMTIPPNFVGSNGFRFFFAKKSSYKKIRGN